MKLRFIVTGIAAGGLLLAATVGAVFAQSATPTDTPTPTATVAPTATPPATGSSSLSPNEKAFADDLASKLGLDDTTVENAVVQARADTAHNAINTIVKNRLDQMVKNGTITQDDENAVLTWFDSRPAVADQLLGHLHVRLALRGHGDSDHGDD